MKKVLSSVMGIAVAGVVIGAAAYSAYIADRRKHLCVPVNNEEENTEE